MKKQTSNVQPAFGRRGDLRARQALNPQHSTSVGLSSRAERRTSRITPDTRKRVLHRIEIAFNRRLLTAACRIYAGKRQEVDHSKTLRRSVMCWQRGYPIGLHTEVGVGVYLEQPDEYFGYDTRTHRAET